MTNLEIQDIISRLIGQTAKDEFDLQLDKFVAEIPPKLELGDLAFPVAFELAKLYKQKTGEKKNPREIAELLKTNIEKLEIVEKVEVAGAGYLNVFFSRAQFLSDPVRGEMPDEAATPDVKICVEHTSVNPNKAAHIGHVRNSVLGDTFIRILRATGKTVEIQNYIDNTGVQVADVVVGFIYLENRDLDAIKKLDAELNDEGKSFDYYCWDLYSKVGVAYQTDEDLKAKRAEVLHLIEEGNNETAVLADYVATRNVQCIIATMDRLSIRYDLLPRESEILHLNFWATAFEKMKQLGVIYFENEGKNAGCWVMPIESHSGTDDHDADKILVRSNGTVTYTGKDIAYQMWKLGLLGLDFHYRLFHTYDDGREVWITTADTSQAQTPSPNFGGGEVVYNVIDSRQSYTQDVVKKGVAAISPERGEAASVHLSYEMVALSPAAAIELGFVISEEDKTKSFIEMSGRKGLGVKADDLIDRLEAASYKRVADKHPDASEEEKQTIAHQLAVAALRYFLLKFTRNTVIVFDFNEALSDEGETGFFCIYSAVRANSIFRKLRETNIDIALSNDTESIAVALSGEAGSDIWQLITIASRLEETLVSAAAANEPAIVAKYVFSLAKAFNLFYHNNKILAEKDPIRQNVLINAAAIARDALIKSLDILGIEVPDKM